MYKRLDELVDAARSRGPVKVAVVAGHDADVIGALKQAQEIGLAEATLIGDAGKIAALTKEVGLDIPDSRIIDEPDATDAARRAVEMIRGGSAQLLMKGKINTGELIRVVLNRETGLRTGRMLSQVIVFQVPGIERLMVMSDAAINIAPTLEHKAEICRNAIEVAHVLGIDAPNVAALCAFEFVNPDMPATLDAAGLSLMNKRGQITGGYIEGPIALDVPLSRFAAERKGIESPLVENTDIFILPDIEAANILYRAILYFAHGESCGVVLGAKVPLVLLSRAETPETKIRSIALGALTSVPS